MKLFDRLVSKSNIEDMYGEIKPKLNKSNKLDINIKNIKNIT